MIGLIKAVGWFLMAIPLGIAYFIASIFTQIAAILGL